MGNLLTCFSLRQLGCLLYAKRRGIIISTKVTFLTALAFPATYQAAWYLFRLMGWHWRNSWDAPGFLFLTGSMPWSQPLLTYEAMSAFRDVFGDDIRSLLIAIVMSVGFAVNITLLKLILVWLKTKVR